MAYILAVDAGGTKAEFLLAQGRTEIGRITSGSLYRLNVSAEEATYTLDTALARIVAATGVPLAQIERTCIGTAGISVPLVVDWLKENFSQRVPGDLMIVGDADIALEAAFPGGRGVLALAGTGSNVAGRGEDMKVITAGGWGPVLANQGSGYWIGLEALRRGFLAIDEQRSTPLLEKARALWRLPSIHALIEAGNAEPRPRFAELAPIVAACAADGDVVSLEILKHAGNELAYLAQLVIDRVAASEHGRPSLPRVAIAGSVLVKIPQVRATMVNLLQNRYPDIRFSPKAVDPVMGAVSYALRDQ